MAEVVNIPKVSASSLTRESSSLSRVQEKASKPEVKKVNYEGGVTVKKQSAWSKFTETFIKEDLPDVGDYILWDIIVPTIARTINDIICGASNRIFLGSGYSQPSGLYRSQGATYVKRTDYGAQSRTQTARTTRQSHEGPSSRRPSFNASDVRFDNREAAETVLDSMIEYLEQAYPTLTVNEFFMMADAGTPPYTVENWGWTISDMADASVIGNIHEGYFIKLPNPKYIKE